MNGIIEEAQELLRLCRSLWSLFSETMESWSGCMGWSHEVLYGEPAGA